MHVCETKVHLFPEGKTAACLFLSLSSFLVLMVKGSLHIPPYPHTLGCTVKTRCFEPLQSRMGWVFFFVFFLNPRSSYVKNVLKVLSIWFSLQLRVQPHSCTLQLMSFPASHNIYFVKWLVRVGAFSETCV